MAFHRPSQDLAPSPDAAPGERTRCGEEAQPASADLTAGGYVCFPRRWLDLPVSPGAKVLLVHFCAAADAEGVSWYGFARLAEMVGRSKASVTGYVDELRGAGVIATERQRTANGFHHRLRVRVLGWSALRAARAAVRRPQAARSAAGTGQEAKAGAIRAAVGTPQARVTSERGIHQVERRNPSGFSTESRDSESGGLINPDRNEALPELDADVLATWRRCRGTSQGLRFDQPPPETVLRAVADHATATARAVGLLDEDARRSAARAAVEAFVARRDLTAEPASLDAAAAALAARVRSRAGLERALTALDADWAAHWRRLSGGAQLARWLDARLAAAPLAFEDLRAIWAIQSRGALARSELARRAQACDPAAQRRVA